MHRRFALVATIVLVPTLWLAGGASAAIHETVASFCSGKFVQDPPGQLNSKGNSFLRALQATRIYNVQFGVAQTGEFGVDFSGPAPVVGPLPAPPAGTTPVSIFVDPTRPNAKLGDFLFWIFFVDGDFAVYLQIFESEHPAFANCPRFSG